MAQISAGITLSYESSNKLHRIPGIKSIPDIGGEPESLETTTLDNLKFTSYTAGLQDLGGAFGFEGNLTPEFRAAVDAAITAAAGKNIKWHLIFPNPLNMEYTWDGEPQPLPVTGVGVNEVLTTTFYVTCENLAGPKELATDTSNPFTDTNNDNVLNDDSTTGATIPTQKTGE